MTNHTEKPGAVARFLSPVAAVLALFLLAGSAQAQTVHVSNLHAKRAVLTFDAARQSVTIRGLYNGRRAAWRYQNGAEAAPLLYVEGLRSRCPRGRQTVRVTPSRLVWGAAGRNWRMFYSIPRACLESGGRCKAKTPY